MDWSESRVKAFIVSGLRAAASKWPPKYETLKDAHTSTKINEKTGRLAKHYTCNKCKGEFPGKDVQVDHIIPIVDPSVGFTTWDEFIKRLFCGKENLQTLCKSCHTIKTKEERQQRKESKNTK